MVALANSYVRTSSELTKKYIVKLIQIQIAIKDKKCQNTAS